MKLTFFDHVFRFTFAPLIPAKVRPNHLTVFRMLLVPFVVFFLYYEMWYIGVPLFLFAALTDWADGALARIRRQVTEWGIIYDPIADKMLIGSALFVVVLQHVNFYLGLALLVVEMGMFIGAWIQKTRGIITSANVWGKIKMFTEVIGILVLLAALWLGVDLLVNISTGTFALALVFALVSIFSRIK